MKKITLLSLSLLCAFASLAQSPGDTIRVKAFDFNSTGRDTLVAFPSDANLTYEKILLKYSLRCHDAAVNNGVSPSEGCRDFDLSCNTYVIDSTKVENVLNTIESHLITNTDETVFPFREEPVYNLLRGTQTNVDITNTVSETAVNVADGSVNSDAILRTENFANKSQYLYTATELMAGGLATGDIDGLSLNVLADAGTANFLEIKIKHTDKDVLNGLVDLDGFISVYRQNTEFVANSENRFNFLTPFNWNGSDNIIVEYNFTNLDSDTLDPTALEVEENAELLGINTVNENELLLTSNAYVETNDYTGILGAQNRTLEAWIRTTDGSNGEIINWGVNTTGRRFTFRLNNGALRLEVQGGGVNSTSTVDDGEWHHVACVLDGTTPGDVRFYIDGVFDPSTNTNGTTIDTRESPIRISRGVLNRFLDATVDEVRIWDTALSEETINEWKSLKLNNIHPNYSNLQLYYDFNETGNTVIDQSTNGRDATIIDGEYRVQTLNGQDLFKDFTLTNERPNTTFYQGEYATNETTTVVDLPIAQVPEYFVTERTVIAGDPTIPISDIIEISSPTQVWSPVQRIYDEETGALISETTLTPDGEIVITDLEFFNRFPFFNELVSFVTPFGIFLDLGDNGESWYFDVTDFQPLLSEDKRLLIDLGGEFQTELDLEFLFIVGTPPRDVLQFEQIWQGSNRFGGNAGLPIAQILDDSQFAPTDVQLIANASQFKLRSSITGHGPLGEFPQNGGLIEHSIFVNGAEQFTWDIFQACGLNSIFPQGGTWLFDRAGWCPGQPTLLTEQDLTPLVTAGSTVSMDYGTTTPNVINNDYRYHAAHQIVAYGPPNFNQDAAVTRIVSPNNSAEFTRVTSCGAPIITIKNTGAATLTSLTIDYWLNDSITPQSFEWSGSLEFMETVDVELPPATELWFDIQENNNLFNVAISNPNGGGDEYSFNNTMSSSIDIPVVMPDEIGILINTNNFSFQNSYTLYDGDGNIVGSNDLNGNNQTFTDEYAIEDGCYRLVIEDTGGDGLSHFASTAQGSGFARIVNPDNNATLVFLEDDFGSELAFNFTNDFLLSTEELAYATSLKVYPNPTSDYATLEGNDLSNASIQIVDIMGRVFIPKITSQSDSQIMLDLQHLATGTYFVVIQNDLLTTSRKVIVK